MKIAKGLKRQGEPLDCRFQQQPSIVYETCAPAIINERVAFGGAGR